MSALKTCKVVYTGPAPQVEGAGFLFPKDSPVEVPAELAESLARGDFRLVTGKGDQ